MKGLTITMNNNTRIIAFGVSCAVTGAALTASLLAPKIVELQDALATEKRFKEFYIRNWKKAMSNVPTPAFITLINESFEDIKFESIVNNFNKN